MVNSSTCLRWYSNQVITCSASSATMSHRTLLPLSRRSYGWPRICAVPVARGRVRLYSGKGAFGFVPPPELTIADYTPSELSNRNTNAALLRYVDNVRRHGHRAALIDPLELMPRQDEVRALNVERYGLKQGEVFDTQGIVHMPPPTKRSIKEITQWLAKAYVGKIGVEYMHTGQKSVRNWCMQLMEQDREELTKQEKERVWKLMTRSESLDQFLQAKFPNVKRYGLEGAESMLPALDMLFHESAQGEKPLSSFYKKRI